MCGRAYQTYTDEELELTYLNRSSSRKLFAERKVNFNLCPTQSSPIVLVKDGQRTIELFRFDLVPRWAKSLKDTAKYSLINAKGEEITEKRSYKLVLSIKSVNLCTAFVFLPSNAQCFN